MDLAVAKCRYAVRAEGTVDQIASLFGSDWIQVGRGRGGGRGRQAGPGSVDDWEDGGDAEWGPLFRARMMTGWMVAGYRRGIGVLVDGGSYRRYLGIGYRMTDWVCGWMVAVYRRGGVTCEGWVVGGGGGGRGGVTAGRD